MLYEFFIITALTLYALLAWTRNTYALYLLAALLPTYLLRLNIFGVPTTFLEVTTLIIFFIGLLKEDIRRHWLQLWHKTPLIFKVAMFIFIVSAFFSVFVNVPVDPFERNAALRRSLGIFKGFIIVPMIWGWIVTTQKRSSALIFSGVIVSVLGLFQIFSVNRITSVYDVPNSLALFLVPLIILTICNTGVFNKISGIIMFVALLGTRSVGGIIALSTLYVLPPFTKTKKLIVLIILLLIFFWPRLTYFLNNQSPTSLDVRLQLWRVATQLIKQQPFVGIGLGRFEPVYQQVLHQWFFERRPNLVPEFVFRDPHNWVFSFWLNTGLLGLLSFIALHLIALFKAEKPMQLALISLLLFGLVDTIYWKNDLASLQWFLLFYSVVTRKEVLVDLKQIGGL